MFSFNLLVRRQSAAIFQRPMRLSTLSVLPKNLQLTAAELAQATVTTKSGVTYDLREPPVNVRPPLWTLLVSTLMRMEPSKVNQQPKKSVLHWLIQNAESREELEAIRTLSLHWRMAMYPITQATTQIWAEACIRLSTPEIFVEMLMDRWTYRQLPINYNMARFVRFLGARGLLDDAFRVFALYPYYGLAYDADAYGALVEACCLVEGEDAWRRALVVAEEALACDPPFITADALAALESRSAAQGETEMAQRYKNLALTLKPTPAKSPKFDDDGNHV